MRRAYCAIVAQRLENTLVRQFRFAKNSATKGLFCGSADMVDKNIDKFLGLESNDVRNSDSSVVEMLYELWNGVKAALNIQFNTISAKLGIPHTQLGVDARDVDAVVDNGINSYSGDWSNKVSSKDRCIQQRKYIKKMMSAAERIFVGKLHEDILSYYGIEKDAAGFRADRHQSVEAIAMGVSAIERELATAERREGILIADSEPRSVDVFTVPLSAADEETTKTWYEYTANPSWVKRMTDHHKNFCVTVDSIFDVMTVSQRLEADLERAGFKVRVYTQGNFLAFANPYSAFAWVGHRLLTMNPDYEIVRNPKSVEVRYMHDDVG